MLRKTYYVGSDEEVDDVLRFLKAQLDGKTDYYYPEQLRKLEVAERPDLKN